ncbi:MAG TPA: protein-disulfide reductase DsbD domain-containing protein [Usitatibacter sp.]|nr:protein-disulfide reductase DsbD domain-containing protein [Usitatibacter sp.]
MFSRIPAAAATAALLLAAGLAHSDPLVKTEHVEAQLVSDQASAQPGKPILVGLKLRMAEHWHTYWKNPGDSGLPTRIQWALPAGWKASPIEWPYPSPLPVGPLMNYGYEDDVVLLSRLTPPADAKPGTADIRAHAEWLVCKDICVPEKGELELSLPVSTAPPRPDPRYLAHIERAQEMLPVAPAGWKSEAAISGKSLIVRITAPEGVAPPAKATFFPERELLIEPAAPEKVARDGRTLQFEMKLADPPLADVKSVDGVAVAQAGWPGTDGRRGLAVAAPVVASLPAMAGSTGAAAGTDAIGGSAWAALAFAFVGGLILNLMPCVFPVLGIKVMGFVKHAHGETRAMRLQGATFAAGVILSFGALAAIMLALRAGGAQLGWGFQLQSPVVVALLACLFFVLALNLSGLFEWGAFAQSMTSSLTARGRYADAFLSGVLATVVATPCTAPFMGAAVGFTMSQGTGLALAVFLMLGAGTALPVFALSLFPALLRKLPRPGAWMETFRQVLAFPLFATSAWLAWVLGAQAGNDAVLSLLLGLVFIALGAWMYGRWAHAGWRWQPALAVLLGALGLFVAWPSSAPAERTAGMARAEGEAWESWTPEKVRGYLAQGRPVFVDFTAAWCVTCQLNKRVALHDGAVEKAFADRRVARLTADWTRQDPAITQALAALGRNAVPVYALYLPGEDSPRLLPEVLTPSIVLSEIERLPARPATAITQR